MVTANAIREHIISQCPWVNPDHTWDRVLLGDGDKAIERVGVCWMPSIENVRAAIDRRCDLLICHEPVFWSADDTDGRWTKRSPGDAKQRLIEESGLAVLRIHDAWDNWPEIGIRDTWAKGLGLTDRIAESEHWHFHGLYAIPPQSLASFARGIARRVQVLGEDSVQVMGDPDRIISRPALGVGCVGPDADLVDLGADCLIVCYDGAPYWAVRQRLGEMGVAVITVEHGTSELWGIESLADYLTATYPDTEFIYLDAHARTWTVRAE